MADAEDLLKNPEKFFRDTLADAGAPIARILYDGEIAAVTGDELVIGYVVGDKRGHYFSEEEAREHMQPGDMLYRIRAERLE